MIIKNNDEISRYQIIVSHSNENHGGIMKRIVFITMVLTVIIALMVFLYFKVFMKIDYSQTRFEKLTKLATQNDMKAQFQLGIRYDNGIDVDKNTEEAMKWYRKSAVNGYATAQYLLGYLNYRGESIEQDKQEAIKWFELASEQGDADAQYYLGWMFENDDSLNHNVSKAFKYYKLAADQGHAWAQYFLGRMYENAINVEHSNQIAIKWYKRSAEQGNAYAQFKLGLMNYGGKGTIRNYEQAYYWWMLVCAISNDEQLIDDAMCNRDLAAKNLNPSQIEKLDKQARNYLKKKDW